MKRLLLKELIEWKNSPNRRPLILEGARQVGKTHLLKEIFGRQEYENVAYLNFQNPSNEVLNLFNGNISPERLISQLELLLHMDIEPGKTLIFFDEIQEVPRALTSLKYFYEEAPEYHVVAAGSLLGIFIHPDASFPVGKVDTLRLEPLNFQEFLMAKGEERIMAHIFEDPTDNTFNSLLMDLFREYLFVGGMPDVVKEWVENHDVMRTEGVQRRILMNYTQDFSKHTDGTFAWRIRQVFDTLPSQFAKANDKFLYGVIKEGARAREYELAIQWLEDAGIVRRVFRVDRGDKLPLSAHVDRSAFKLYFLDIGLFRCLAEISPEVTFQKSAIFDEFNGLIAEQFVLQELSQWYRKIYYWSTDAKAEVDFILQSGKNIIPVEVKSGENVHAKSLKYYREKYHPEFSVRFSLRELNYADELMNVSLYKIFLANRPFRWLIDAIKGANLS